MSKTGEVRERIAFHISIAYKLGLQKNPISCPDTAEQILADPNILIKAENQELPILPQTVMESQRITQAKTMNAMLNDGWVRVEKK